MVWLEIVNATMLLIFTFVIGTSLVTGYCALAQHQNITLLILASVNVSAPQVLPNWLRGRGLAVYY